MRRWPLLVVLMAGTALAACDEDGATAGVATPTITAAGPSPTSTPQPVATPSPTVADSRIALEVKGANASAVVRVELAVSEDEIRTGLMHRESLPEDAGMLFIFEAPSHRGFWMKDTLIPLDIAYLDSTGTINEIHRGEPLDQAVMVPALPYWYVLEVNAGWFERNGLGVGDRLVIPADFEDKS